MPQEQWTAVDRYITDLHVPADAVLDGALAASAAAGLPSINVSPNQGKLLHLLARMHGAKKILEIGTLGGYSTIWMARALPPGGSLTTLEFDPKHAEVARSNMTAAGLNHLVDIRLGAAIDILPQLVSHAPFDFIFIDADKVNTVEYFQWALRLSRKGSVIIVDNVVRDGQIINPATVDPAVQAVCQFHKLLATEKRVSATAVQTVGSKGYDGFAIAIVID